jgi:hypothetical protein
MRYASPDPPSRNAIQVPKEKTLTRWVVNVAVEPPLVEVETRERLDGLPSVSVVGLIAAV